MFLYTKKVMLWIFGGSNSDYLQGIMKLQPIFQQMLFLQIKKIVQ